MKHIGIAAVTAEGAALVYRQICALAAQQLGGHRHPEITLHSFSLSEHVEAGDGPQRQARWADLMRRSAAKLCAAGADFIICPSNTPHDVYAQVAPQLPVPWLHIAQAVRRVAQASGARHALLLGTRFTIASDLYDRSFDGSGIALLRPEDEEVRRMHQIILDELVPGRASAASRAWFGQLIGAYAARGADSVILGCTELPLAIDAGTSGLPVLDSTAALAQWAVEQAIGG